MIAKLNMLKRIYYSDLRNLNSGKVVSHLLRDRNEATEIIIADRDAYPYGFGHGFLDYKPHDNMRRAIGELYDFDGFKYQLESIQRGISVFPFDSVFILHYT